MTRNQLLPGLALCGLLGACTVTLPAPDAPPRYAPLLRESPRAVPDGQGRVLVDAVNGPARVSLVEPTGERFLCLSPCEADLPPGLQTLHLVVDDDHDGFVQVDVRPAPAVYQGIVGIHRTHGLSRKLTAGVAVLGAVVTTWAAIAYATAKPTGPIYRGGVGFEPEPGDDGRGGATVGMLIGGGLLLGGGAVALWLGDEEQPSTFVRWEPPAAARP